MTFPKSHLLNGVFSRFKLTISKGRKWKSKKGKKVVFSLGEFNCSCCLTSLACSGSHSYVCQPRLTTIQRLAWVQLRVRGHILQYLSCWCSAGSVIERQEVVGAGSASTSQRIVFFGRVMNLQLHIFRLPVWISHLHGGTFLVCLDFHCGQHKGIWDGMWEQWGCAACFGVCLTASVCGWCRVFVHEVNGHPLPDWRWESLRRKPWHAVTLRARNLLSSG